LSPLLSSFRLSLSLLHCTFSKYLVVSTMAEEKKEESVSFTISYFGIGGRGAPLRAAAFMGGLSYRDRFVTGVQHRETKAAGNRRWTGIPELTLHDKDGNDVITIGQSNVCLTLIGSMAGSYPKDMVSQALVDEILASVEDCMAFLGPSFREKDEEKKKAMRLDLMKEDKFPYWMAKFEQRLEENEKRGHKNGLSVGDSITVADIKLYYGLVFLTGGALDHIDGPALLKPNKRITAFMEKMKADENLNKFEAAFKEQVAKYDKGKGEADHVIKGKNVYAAL